VPRSIRLKASASLTALVAAAAVLAAVPHSARAYVPLPSTFYELPSQEPCLKGRGNCIVYPKATQLPSGRLIAAFEKSTVAASGSAVGQTVPVWKSDDNGDTWQPLSEVAPPAEMSTDPAVAKYSSNWTNPYLFVLPQKVGNLAAGTLLLATVVSGEDYYYVERKAADPNWVPTNDGDRKDVSIALYASTTEGQSWNFVNIIAPGGWQGGGAGAAGQNISNANSFAQIDPVWEPHLRVHNGQLVAYYSDENEYTSYSATSGVPTPDPQNSTSTDPNAQVLVHRTWDGVAGSWSGPVIDVPGDTFSFDGKSLIGGGRPGMTNVAATSDGKYMLTFEYFGGGANVRFKMASDPLRFYNDNDPNGSEISLASGQQGALPYAPGSRGLSWGGSPVVVNLPDGRLVYNANGSPDVWVNRSGRSDGVWTQFRTVMPAGYSRNLTWERNTGRLVILSSVWGGPTDNPRIRHGHVDVGNSGGPYYRLINQKTGHVIGTGGNITDADIGNSNTPDVRLEASGAAADPHTQQWHLVTKSDGRTTLLNRSGGRAASIWTGSATLGQRIGQWVDDTTGGQWNIVPSANGRVKLQSGADTSLYLTGTSPDAYLTLQQGTTDGSQDWQLVEVSPGAADTTAPAVSGSVANRTLTLTASDSGSGVASIQYRNAGTTTWKTYTAPVRFSGNKAVTVEFRATDVSGNVSSTQTIVIPTG
jgi:hypothetical protein